MASVRASYRHRGEKALAQKTGHRPEYRDIAGSLAEQTRTSTWPVWRDSILVPAWSTAGTQRELQAQCIRGLLGPVLMAKRPAALHAQPHPGPFGFLWRLVHHGEPVRATRHRPCRARAVRGMCLLSALRRQATICGAGGFPKTTGDGPESSMDVCVTTVSLSVWHLIGAACFVGFVVLVIVWPKRH